jgi:hypothetical protein
MRHTLIVVRAADTPTGSAELYLPTGQQPRGPTTVTVRIGRNASRAGAPAREVLALHPVAQQPRLVSNATAGRKRPAWPGGAPHALSVTAPKQVLGSRLKALGAEQLEAEGVGEPAGGVERGADRQSVLDLLR